MGRVCVLGQGRRMITRRAFVGLLGAVAAAPFVPTMRCDAFRPSLLGRECFLGIDLSDKIDLSSVVAIFPRALEREDAEEAAAAERAPAGDDRSSITCAIDVLPFFWMPEKTLHKRALEDGIPYPDWKRDGFITTWPGSLIDHDAIVEFIIAELAVLYRIRGIGIDQAGAAGVVSKLKRHFGEELVDEIPQGFRSLNEPSKLMEALIITGNLTHDGNPCMAMCMGNMGKEENAWREIRPVKLSQRKRIDGGVALIDALAKMTKTPAAQRSVYQTRGVRTLGE
jgi:phage terminase large subunit-like protein